MTFIQPTVFPRFSEEMLGFTLNVNLAPEVSGDEGRPDFAPADPATHPFVFETKPTNAGVNLEGFTEQVGRYLALGRPRIKRVVLTNLVGLRVFELDSRDAVVEILTINLRGLLDGDERAVAELGEAQRLASFLEDYRFRELSPEEKLERVRSAPPWNPVIEVTTAEWISRRLDLVVSTLQKDVQEQVMSGVLENTARVDPAVTRLIVGELHSLEWRLGSLPHETEGHDLRHYLTARDGSVAAKALRQYCAHVAYYATTRLTLVRIWEDLELLSPVLYDGGFDALMSALGDAVSRVVAHSFEAARNRYSALFGHQNSYTWYEPEHDAYCEAIYELANTYFGAIESDVLGTVYERLLERIDRKLLGQYYTPRDIISLMWSLLDIDGLSEQAEVQERLPRVLDIATGSGGFLVEAAKRLRVRLERQLDAGASTSRQAWIDALAEGLNGVEIQRFPAYLAELNLLVQIAHLVAKEPDLRVPPLGILAADTLSLHNPQELFRDERQDPSHELLIDQGEDRRIRAQKIEEPASSNFLMDVACGNPPYVGQKAAAEVMRRTRNDFPYWERFVGQHMDYLYWFLILGVSKLRRGGRFAFITTEYWLRAAGANKLREYLARRCKIERIVLFRDMRLFLDAPGQHSMIVVGERMVPPDELYEQNPDAHTFRSTRPKVSVYLGPNTGPSERRAVLDVLTRGGNDLSVSSFSAQYSPNELLAESWSEIVLSPDQLARRQRVRMNSTPLELDLEEGVLSAADRMRSGYEESLPAATLTRIGYPQRRAGIFVVKDSERRALEPLNNEESALLRPVVNTRDVYPYAVVLDGEPDEVVYLTAPEEVRADLSDEQVWSLPFPAGLPKLNDHLRQFKPLLESKVEAYGERRPWWSIHRPRRRTVARSLGDGHWADYCVTSRWGEGGRMVVGLAPSGAVPLSGLHALLAPDGVPAPYVCALFNSTVVQELTDTLPPGQLRARDLSDLGLPLLPDLLDEVASCGLELADMVKDLVRVHGRRFPRLLDEIRGDVGLGGVLDDSWLPAAGPRSTWGSLSSVSWIESIARTGAGSARLSDVSTRHGLFGVTMEVTGPGCRVEIRLQDAEDTLLEALAAYIRGAALVGTQASSLETIQVPIDPSLLHRLFATERGRLAAAIASYRRKRQDVDDALGVAF